MNRETQVQSAAYVMAAALVAIPQILFFWLAPDADCRMVVYAFGTGYSLIHVLWCLYLWKTKGVRVATPPVYLSIGFWIAELLICGVLLALLVARLSAVYALITCGLLDLIVEAALFLSLGR